MLHGEADAAAAAEVGHETLVALTLLAAQMEIAVQGFDIASRGLQCQHQGDGVGPSAQSAQHQALPDSHAVLSEEGLHTLYCSLAVFIHHRNIQVGSIN